jgi:PAS domain S-box-containing protein
MVRDIGEYAIFMMTPEGRIVSWNQGVERIFGYRESEFIGQPSALVFTPEDRERGEVEKELTEAARSGEATDNRWHLKKDGSRFWCNGMVTAMRDEAGELYGFVKVMRDNTGQHQAQEAIRESEARYRTLLGSMDEGFCILEMLFNDAGEPVDYRFVEINPAFERMTGLRRAVGKTARELVPDLESWWVETYGRVASTGEAVRFEHGSEAMNRWFEVYASPVGMPGSRRVTLLFNNITERKESELALRSLNETLERRVEERTEALARTVEELRRSEQRFAQAFFISPFAAALTTLDEDRFVEVNDAFSRLTGYDPEEAIGRTSKDLGMWSSPEDREKMNRAVHSGKGFRELELSLRTKDGATCSIVMSAAIVPDSAGQVMLKMFYDITERKRNEEQLLQAVEAVMADTTWFSRAVVEKLAQVRSGVRDAPSVVELTPREKQVLERIAKGMNSEQVAADLGLSIQTVRNYTASIYGKIGVHSRAAAVIWARERGLV